MQTTYAGIFALLTTFAMTVTAAAQEAAATATGLQGVELGAGSGSAGYQERHLSLDYGLTASHTLDALYFQSTDGTTALTDGISGYGLGLTTATTYGWWRLGYQHSAQLGVVSTQGLSLDLGHKGERWDFALTPRYTSTTLYNTGGPRSQQTIVSPGVGVAVTRHGERWGWGAEAGMNLYPKRLDTYSMEPRLGMSFDPTVSQFVAGMEKFYARVFVTRQSGWGQWGVYQTHSISALDDAAADVTAAHLTYFLGDHWDGLAAITQGGYAGVNSQGFSVGLRYLNF